jgi:hypothetical protein
MQDKVQNTVEAYRGLVDNWDIDAIISDIAEPNEQQVMLELYELIERMSWKRRGQRLSSYAKTTESRGIYFPRPRQKRAA